MEMTLCSFIWLRMWEAFEQAFLLIDSSKYFETAYESSMTGNWTQLYTDGVVKMGVGFAAAGILNGLTRIQRRGYQKVVIHTYILEVVKTIQDVHLADSSFALLQRIHMSLQAIQHWKIKHIPRERNQVVDRIAKMATERSTYL
ncbi:hypothetical protein Gohar_009169, partial [Gossypium harknessii]|nr:hypothetical protein [Gossypium harknessii]